LLVDKVREEVKRVERLVEEHYRNLAGCLENRLSIQTTQLLLNQKLVGSHRQFKGIIQFLQVGDDEVDILESEIRRMRSRPISDDFDIRELQVKVMLNR